MKKSPKWNENEVNILCQNLDKLQDQEPWRALLPGRNLRAIKNKVIQLKRTGQLMDTTHWSAVNSSEEQEETTNDVQVKTEDVEMQTEITHSGEPEIIDLCSDTE